jgi:predicted Zn-dependent protease
MLAAGQPASALPFAEKALELDPRDPTALKLSARIYSELNCPADAARALERAAASAPRDASTQYQLYRAWQLLGNETKAAAALREFERLRAVYGLQPQ